MATDAELNEESKENLIKRIRNLEKKVTELYGLVEIVLKQKSELEDNLPKNKSGDKILFNEKWPYVDKLVYILKLAQRPMLSSEILELLIKYDFNARHWRDPVKGLSVHLTKAVKYKMIISHKTLGKIGLSYSLPEWAEKEDRF